MNGGQPIPASGRVSFGKGEGGQASSLSIASPNQNAPSRVNAAASSPPRPPSPPNPQVSTDERKAEVKWTLGAQLLNQGDRSKFADAVVDLTEAIELKSNYVEAYVDRCRAYTLLSMAPRAIEDCSHAIELKPDEANAYYWRANATRPDPRAVEDYTRAIQLNPRFANAYQNRGLYYLNHNRIREAIQDYSEAIRIQPGNSNLYYQRGLAYVKANDLQNALVDFDAAIQRSPNFSEAYNSRAQARDANGDREGADADRQRYQQLKSSGPSPLSNSGPRQRLCPRILRPSPQGPRLPALRYRRTFIAQATAFPILSSCENWSRTTRKPRERPSWRALLCCKSSSMGMAMRSTRG